jgi:hypothetical protein
MKWTQALPWLVFFLVLALTWKTLGGYSGYEVAKIAVSGSAGYSKKDATDYAGGDIKTVSGTLNMCKAVCGVNKDCVGFVRENGSDYSWKKCFLKNSVTSSTARVNTGFNAYGKPGVLLPEVLQTSTPWTQGDHVKWTYENATDYPGNDLGGIANQYDTSCTNACARINGCVGVSRNIDRPGYCWFKSAKGKGVFDRNIHSIFFS